MVASFKKLERKTRIKYRLLKTNAAFRSITIPTPKPMIESIPIFSDNQLKRVVAPLQLLCGDHDVLLDSNGTAERLNRNLPKSQIHLFKDTGHVIVDQFATVKQFLLTV